MSSNTPKPHQHRIGGQLLHSLGVDVSHQDRDETLEPTSVTGCVAPEFGEQAAERRIGLDHIDR